MEGGFVTVVDVDPTWRYTSLFGAVPVGLGSGVGDCHGAVVLFISLSVFSRVRNYVFLRVCVCVFFGGIFVYC